MCPVAFQMKMGSLSKEKISFFDIFHSIRSYSWLKGHESIFIDSNVWL